MTLDERRKGAIRALRRWHRSHRRPFSWRETASPYETLVAEVLLQRSRAATVEPVYADLLERWPDAAGLAKARVRDIENIVRPLGLTSRAKRLRELAVALVALGGVPRDEASLRALPGVGRYAARATLARMGRRTPVVDGVSGRVYRRVFGRPGAEDGALWALAEWATPRRDVASWNWAVLDLAATICLPRLPRCASCPLRAVCVSAKSARGGA